VSQQPRSISGDQDASLLAEVIASRPNGLTTEELCCTLHRASRGAVSPTQVLLGIAQLQQLRVIRLGRDRRWRYATSRHFATVPKTPQGADGGRVHVDLPGPSRNLHAITGSISSTPLSADHQAPSAIVTPDVKGSVPERLLQPLLQYYASALSADHRPAATFTEDHYQQTFILCAADRALQPQGIDSPHILSFPLSSLPNTIKEVLARRRRGSVFLGFPLAVFHYGADLDERRPINFIRPVGILNCRWKMNDWLWSIEVPPGTVSINPEFLKHDVPRQHRTAIARFLECDPQEEDNIEALSYGSDMAGLAHQLALALASRVHTPLDLANLDRVLHLDGRSGLFNCAMLFFQPDTTYSRGAVQDLRLIAQVPTDELKRTALNHLVAPPAAVQAKPTDMNPLFVQPLELNELQLLAGREALTSPVTAITGPPGTGKSQVIACIAVSAAASGMSVLIATHTHRALDSACTRISELVPDHPFVIRAVPNDGSTRVHLADGVQLLLDRPPEAIAPLQFASLRDKLLRVGSELDALNDAVAAYERAKAEFCHTFAGKQARPHSPEEVEGPPAPRQVPSIWRRIAAMLLAAIRKRPEHADPTHPTPSPPGDAELRHLARRLTDAEQTCQGLDEKIPILQRQLGELSGRLLPLLAAWLPHLSADARQELQSLAADFQVGVLDLAGQDRLFALILRHLPIWATTILGAPGRFPLRPGLFDLVIFDEAAATDIASAVPLLFRAKRVVVVGDPAQLTRPSSYTTEADRLLLQQHGLLQKGLGRFAQSQSSLFDCLAHLSWTRRHFLSEHFRCHPDIVGYFGPTFYGRNSLVPLTDERRLAVPPGSRPGIQWSDIVGDVIAAPGGGCVAPREADAVVDHLVNLLVDQKYHGSIAIITPFRQQQELIVAKVEERIGIDLVSASRLQVATVHKMQGDERDLVLFSLCSGPTMPTGARHFLGDQKSLFNVAASRARAVFHVFGDRNFARTSGIPHLVALERRASGAHGQPETVAPFESPWEERLYEALCARGLRPIPQFPLLGRRLDLAVQSPDGRIRIDVEVDGFTYHTGPDGQRLGSDIWRDSQIKAAGWIVKRFWVWMLEANLEGCVDDVVKLLASR
jgi:very-short-patch-repair endonuclease